MLDIGNYGGKDTRKKKDYIVFCSYHSLLLHRKDKFIKEINLSLYLPVCETTPGLVDN